MHGDVGGPGASYEERCRPVALDLVIFPFMVAGLVVGVPALDSVMGVVVTVFCGSVLALRAVQLGSRRVMLRVDSAGFMLGISPPWPERNAVVPWEDLHAVVLWRQHTGYGSSLRYLALLRREGAPPLPGSRSAGGFLTRAARPLVPADLPAQAVADSRPVAGWRIDRATLAMLVARFAPHVEIDDRW